MATENDVAILYITDRGLGLAEKLQSLYPEALVARFNAGTAQQVWHTKRVLIFIMAAGIVVRTIGPLLEDKRKDPAVIVLDEKGKFAISLLSGHVGGANERTEEIANFLKGSPVITTASDVSNATSIDMWAKENGLAIEDWKKIPRIGARLLNKGALKVYTDIPLDFPEDFLKVNDLGTADLVITNKTGFSGRGRLVLRPRNLIIGVGCNKNTTMEEIEEAVKKTLVENGLSFLSVHSLATIDRKGDEPGLLSFAERHSLEIGTYTAQELNGVKGIAKSEAAFKATGAQAVAEPAALLASGAGRILVSKQKIGNVTVAVAKIPLRVTRHASRGKDKDGNPKRELETTGGLIYVVGTGPGSVEHVTPRAAQAIEDSDVIVGYGTYLNLIQELLAGKEVISTGMTKEVERCRKAVELALKGKKVSVISGGDPGIFAMAGLVFEVLKNQDNRKRALKVTVEVVPGISALNACAARLGAPLMHDFAAISLSDRLTPWDLIEKRLEAAAVSDLVIVLYNPKSMGRQEQIERAVRVVLKSRSPQTPVGLVRAAMRDDEAVTVTNLREVLNHHIDMQTTVIIGNSHTFTWNNRIITPRGYEKKFKI